MSIFTNKIAYLPIRQPTRHWREDYPPLAGRGEKAKYIILLYFLPIRLRATNVSRGSVERPHRNATRRSPYRAASQECYEDAHQVLGWVGRRGVGTACQGSLVGTTTRR